MSKKYTSFFNVMTDTQLWIAKKKGTTLDLGILYDVARLRWPWIVSTWSLSLKQFFKTKAAGSANLEKAIDELDRMVESYNLGNISNPLDNSQTYAALTPLLSLITVDTLTLTPEERLAIDKEMQRVGNFQIEDFRAMVDLIRQQSAISAYSIGLGDDTGCSLMGVNSAPRLRTATVSDLIVLENMTEAKRFIEGIIIDYKGKVDRPPNLLSAANKNIDPSSQYRVNNSYRSSVAMPFEISLEHMAQKYLGSKDRFYELVTVNGLQPPYIDEAGEKLLLVSPGALNNVIIPGTRVDDLSVGTKVTVGSYRHKEEPRIIEKILINGDNSMILFLSGAQDLSKLKTTEGAFVRVYKPNTVNSGSFILIPLTAPPGTTTPYTPKSDELRRLSAALLNFGVDILRDEKTGGLLVDSNGNFRYAAGYDNIRQTVLFALKTRRGELPFHRGFGVPNTIGDKYYGTADEAVIFANFLRKILLADPRFEEVKVANLAATGTGVALSFQVRIRGTNEPFPLSFIS